MSLADSLLNLHRVDGQVRGLRSRLESAERTLTIQTDRVDELQQQHDELEARRRQIQAKIANLETETGAIDERIEKLRGELNSASTNKQYTAILTELNTVKLSRSGIEDRILQEMEQSDQAAEQLRTLEGMLDERRKVRGVAEQELGRRKEEVGQRLEELEAERRVAAEGVPEGALRVFNELADAYDGEAMAPVEEVSRRHREYACGLCNIQLPFDAIAKLLGTSDELIQCTACDRILYMQDEMRGAFANKK